MTRNEFAHKVAKDTGAPFSRTKPWVDDVLNSLADALITENEIKLSGVGTFKHVHRKERYGRNASTGERIFVPAKTAVKFIASSAIAESVKDVPVPVDNE